MTSWCRTLAVVAVVVCLSVPICPAQGTREDYQRAQQFLPGNLRHRGYIAEVIRHWIAEKRRLWYRKAGTKGTAFVLVERQRNTSSPAFEHARSDVALAQAP